MSNPVVSWLTGIAAQLRFPWLLAMTVLLLLIDLAVPDLIPFVDEILLSLTALVLASFRKPKPAPESAQGTPVPGKDPKGPVIDVDPVPPREPKDDCS
jgi:hypothetical protein